MDIAAYVPGKSAVSGVEKPIKLSSNENPFGASLRVVEAMKKAMQDIYRYPDGNCRELREAIAKHYIIDGERIVCGAGSDELLALLCQAYAGAGDEVICTDHGFLMYPISALRVGAKPVIAADGDNLEISIDNILAAVTDKTRIVFVANPNNPTGDYITKKNARRLRAGLPDNVLLVIDAAYGEYVSVEDYSTGLGMVDRAGNNTVMTRTFSKIYGLGGLRLGWMYGPAAVVDVINRIRGPFNVSNIAQAAGIAAVSDQGFLEKSRLHNDKWLKIVSDRLRKIGLKVYPSVANFVLVDFSRLPAANNQRPTANSQQPTAGIADKFLQENGIIGRRMNAYKLPDCMRFTIGLEEENRQLTRVLEEFIDTIS